MHQSLSVLVRIHSSLAGYLAGLEKIVLTGLSFLLLAIEDIRILRLLFSQKNKTKENCFLLQLPLDSDLFNIIFLAGSVEDDFGLRVINKIKGDFI